MKTKTIILFLVCALITLSFTFVSVSHKTSNDKNVNSDKPLLTQEEPAGGFISEDKL